MVSPVANPDPDVTRLAANIRAGNRAALARAITLIESRRADHEATARELVQELLPATGNAIRVGITGSPGVGKSTTIDALRSEERRVGKECRPSDEQHTASRNHRRYNNTRG